MGVLLWNILTCSLFRDSASLNYFIQKARYDRLGCSWFDINIDCFLYGYEIYTSGIGRHFIVEYIKYYSAIGTGSLFCDNASLLYFIQKARHGPLGYG